MVDIDSATSVLVRKGSLHLEWERLTPELREAMRKHTLAFGGKTTIHDTEDAAKDTAYLAMAFSPRFAYVSVYPLCNSWVCAYHEAEQQPHRRYLA